MKRFFYLATPYSKFEGGLDAAFKFAARQAALFVRAGIPVYSPIAHTHPIAFVAGIDPYNHAIWMPFDEPMMVAAHGLIVVMADGWDVSKGIAMEIETFKAAHKPILYMVPDELPLGAAALDRAPPERASTEPPSPFFVEGGQTYIREAAIGTLTANSIGPGTIDPSQITITGPLTVYDKDGSTLLTTEASAVADQADAVE